MMTPEQMALVQAIADTTHSATGEALDALLALVTTLQQETAALVKDRAERELAEVKGPQLGMPRIVTHATAEQLVSIADSAGHGPLMVGGDCLRAALITLYAEKAQAEATTRRLEHERDVADRSGRAFAEEARRLREALEAVRDDVVAAVDEAAREYEMNQPYPIRAVRYLSYLNDANKRLAKLDAALAGEEPNRG